MFKRLSVKMNKGFTLTEILIVISIFTLLTIILILNYRAAGERLNLYRSAHKLAQDIRRVQEMAMAARQLNGEIPEGGYGVYFNENEPNHYILFADLDKNQKYTASSDKLIEDISLEKESNISEISSGSDLTIIFTPPNPNVNFAPDADTVSITLGGSGKKKYSYELSDRGLSGHLYPRAQCDTDESTENCGNTFDATALDPDYVFDWYQIKSEQFIFITVCSGHVTSCVSYNGARASCDKNASLGDCPLFFSPSGSDSQYNYLFDWYTTGGGWFKRNYSAVFRKTEIINNYSNKYQKKVILPEVMGISVKVNKAGLIYVE